MVEQVFSGYRATRHNTTIDYLSLQIDFNNRGAHEFECRKALICYDEKGESQTKGELVHRESPDHSASRSPEARWMGRFTAMASRLGSAQISMDARDLVTAV
jgi:hypothetical protein